MSEHAHLDKMNLIELADRLADLEGRRTPVGWSPDDAVERAAVERRIMELVGGTPPGSERRQNLRMPCEVKVRLRSKEQQVRAKVMDIGVGGVFCATKGEFEIGTNVQIEVRAHESEHGLRVRGSVAWKKGEGIGISFGDLKNADRERRLRRFVLELIRHRAANR